MTLLLSGAASCARMEIVPRQEPEAGAIVFAPKVETDNWLSVSPASASSVAAPPEYSLSELRDAQGRQRLYLHAFYHAAGESASPLPETRGAVLDNNNFADACGSFGVTAYAYRGKWADGGDRSIYISDKQTVRNNGTYDFSPSVFWPERNSSWLSSHTPLTEPLTRTALDGMVFPNSAIPYRKILRIRKIF